MHVHNLSVSYGRISAIREVSLRVEPGEVVAVIGANGAGKTTILRAVSGVLPQVTGTVTFNDQNISVLAPHERVALGIVQVPEGRQVFNTLTVEDNIRLGAIRRGADEIEESLVQSFELFPDLKRSRGAFAGNLSGGQQQMLAIARALAARPRVLMLDEPSMGISPILAKQIFGRVAKLRDSGIGILLVEQNAWGALRISDRGYVVENGKVMLEDSASALIKDKNIRSVYLGG